MENTKNFTSGKILAPLISFALPVLGALFLQTMYGAVDMLVVGQFATAADVSAVSTGSWIMQLITSFVVGIAMGTTILLGRKIGEGKEKEASSVIGASIGLFIIIAIIITFVMELFASQCAIIMQTPFEAYKQTVQYIRVCSAGAVFIIAYNVLGSIFRGIGNSKIPLITVMIACICNILGDYLLVGFLNMATLGAAVATVFAQTISVLLSILIIRHQKFPFEFHKTDITFNLKKMAEIFKLGLPIALQDVLVNISFLTITAIVNTLGVIASAGVGVAEKLCGFIMLVPSSFNQAMSSFVSQNMGARQVKRANKALFYGIMMSLIVGMIMAYFSFFHGDLLASLFAKDKAVILAAADYLKAYAIDCILVSIMFCMIGYFNGCGQTIFVMIQGISGAFGVRIPVSFIMSQMKPVSLFKVGLATPCSSFLQIILCLTYFIYFKKKNYGLSSSPEKIDNVDII